MWRLCVLATLFVCSVNGLHTFNDESLIVNTTGGLIQGEVLSSGIFSNYFSYKGIPYGEPPVGDLRFRAPLAHTGWEGVRDGTQHGFNCPSTSTLNSNTNEDCLFLNVYSPNLLGRRAVMFYIHDGDFSSGSGDSWVYGPDHLIDEDVLIVTINYRLGALGFLSTGDLHAPGNYGMKDMVLALRWVQENILAFGGDPDSVTIFGSGAAAHYLMLSPSATGLFHRAISQSGSALNSWAFQPNPEPMAYQLGRALRIETTTSEELIAALRTQSFSDIVNASPTTMSLPIVRATFPTFVPVLDPVGVSAEEQFLPDRPINIIRSASFNPVPFISGYADAEGLHRLPEISSDPSVFPTINAFPELLVPRDWNIPFGSSASQQIAQEIRDFYFGGRQLANDMRVEWSDYLTDAMFAAGIDHQIRLHSERQSAPIYYYRFSFDGSLNMVKSILRLGDYDGATHGDDTFYLFSVTRFPPLLSPTNAAISTRRRMVRMWANFAKFGDPTPTTDLLVITQRWTRVMGAQEFMDVRDSLVFGRMPFRERMEFWDQLRRRFAPSS